MEYLDHSDHCNQHHFLCGIVFVVFTIVKRLDLKLQRDSDEQWGHTERRYYDNWQRIDWRADGMKYRTMELESRTEHFERDAREAGNYGDKIERLRNYTRRIIVD